MLDAFKDWFNILGDTIIYNFIVLYNFFAES